MTADKFIRVPRECTIAGLTYSVLPMTFREWAKVQAWLIQNGRSPLRRIDPDHLATLPESAQLVIVKSAYDDQRKWPPPIATSAWFEAISEADGGDVQLIFFILSRTKEGMTTDEAEYLYKRMTNEEARDFLLAARGEDPVPKSPPQPTSSEG